MKTLQQIAWYQNRRDEKPNQVLKGAIKKLFKMLLTVEEPI